MCVCCCKFTILKDDLRRHGSYHSISPKSAKGNSLIVVCRSDFSISRGGLNDVKRQVQRVVHKKRLKNVKKNATISDYWGEYSHLAHSLKVTSAELAMVQFIYNHIYSSVRIQPSFLSYKPPHRFVSLDVFSSIIAGEFAQVDAQRQGQSSAMHKGSTNQYAL